MRRILLFVAIASTLLAANACQNEPTNPVEPSGSSAFSRIESSVSPVEPPPDPLFEPTPDWILEDLDYEEFHGTINPGEAGFLYGEMSTWPGGSYFAIQIPPGALPGEPGDPPIPFSIRVPTRASYDRYQHRNDGRGLPLILDMEPSGVNFLVPLQIHTTWMPWAPVGVRAEDWEVWCLDPDLVYYDVLSVAKVKKTVTVTFEAPHFSRWETGGPDPR